MDYYITSSGCLVPVNALCHHGILGMKWGIRRYQNKNGSLTPLGKERLVEKRIRTSENLVAKTIPKGTKMYRTTVSEKDVTVSGPTYVTFQDIDRHLYREGSLVKRYAGDKQNVDVYEHELELKTDVKIPSLETVRHLERQLMADEKHRREVAESWCKEMMLADSADYSFKEVKQASDLASKYDLNDPVSRRKALVEATKKYGSVDGDYTYQRALDIADAIDWVNTNDMLVVEQSLGMANGTKTRLIKELQRYGYNAMYDNASIGVRGDGTYNKNQEGIEPLIIFDANSTLKETSVVKVDRDSQARSSKYYNDWKTERDEVLRKFK